MSGNGDPARQNIASLTPTLTHNSSIPFPRLKVTPGKEDSEAPKSEIDFDSSEKIIVRACSEFTHHIAAVSPVAARNRIAVINDQAGSPVVLSVGTDHRFYVLRHVNGAEAWKVTDATPAHRDANRQYLCVTFDVGQDPTTGVVNFVISLVDRASDVTDPDLEGDTEVWACPEVTIDADGAFLSPNLDWHQLPVNLPDGPRDVKVLRVSSLGTISNRATHTIHHPFAFAGTSYTGRLNGFEYIVDLNPANAAQAWSYGESSQVAAKFVALESARISEPNGAGSVGLYQTAGYATDDEDKYGPEGGNAVSYQRITTARSPQNTFIDLQLANIGGIAYDISTVVNASNRETDVVVAGAAGIGFYPSTHLSSPPQVVLGNIRFRQIIASQCASVLAIAAVDHRGNLYYIQGTRNGSSMTFSASGLPIRTGVEHLAVQRNSVQNVTDCLYLDKSGHLQHLVRSPNGLWSATRIYVAATADKQIKEPSYITQLSFEDTTGRKAPAGYEIHLSASEVSYYYLNGQTYCIGQDPTPVKVDKGGITLISHTDVNLRHADLTLHLKHDDKTESFEVCQSQRVLNKLAKIKSSEDVQNSTNTKGQSTSISKLKSEKFTPVMPLFEQMGNIITGVVPDAAKQLGEDISDSAQDFAASFSFDGVEWHHSPHGDDELENFFIDVGDFVGDVFEAIGHAAKAIFKFCLRVQAGLASFFIKIEGTIFKFVVKTLATIARNFAVCLALTLGIDLTDFIDWLGYALDWDGIKDTTKVLGEFAHDGFTFVGNMMQANMPYYRELVVVARALLSQAIPDYREPAPTDQAAQQDSSMSTLKDALGTVYDMLFNNPIIKGLQDILMKILSWFLEPLEDMVKVPSPNKVIEIIEEALKDVGDITLATIMAFIDDMYNKVSDYVDGKISLGELLKELLADTFWDLFDMLTSLFLTSMELTGRLIIAIEEIFSAVWKIPVISAWWEFFTEMDLSIANLLFAPIAACLNIWSFAVYDQLPFDQFEHPSKLIPSVQSCTLDPAPLAAIKVQLDSRHHSDSRTLSLASTNQENKQLLLVDLGGTRLRMLDESSDGHGGNAGAGNDGDGGTDGGEGGDSGAGEGEGNEEKTPEEYAALKKYRTADAICGTSGAIFAGLNVLLEILMGEEPAKAAEAKANAAQAEKDFKEYRKRHPLRAPKPLQDDRVIELDPRMPHADPHAFPLEFSDPPNPNSHKKRAMFAIIGKGVLTAFSLAIGGGSLATTILNTTLTPTMHTGFIVLKSVGLAFNATAFVLSLYGVLKMDPGMGRRILGLVSGIVFPIGNIVGSCVPGFWEYTEAASHNEGTREMRDMRVSGDCMEFLANVTSMVGSGFEAAEQDELLLGSQIVDGAFTVTSLGLSITLVVKYQQDQKNLE